MQPAYHFRTLEEIEPLIEQVAPLFPQEAKIRLGLRELMTNAIEHGNLEIHYEEKTRLLEQGQWRAEIMRRLNQAQYQQRIASISFERGLHAIIAEIRDGGNGFLWEEYLNQSAERLLHPHGRGIALANHFCFDKLEYTPEGNLVRASIYLR